MATTVVMPQMGFDMQEGTIVRWLKAGGGPGQPGESPLRRLKRTRPLWRWRPTPPASCWRLWLVKGVDRSRGPGDCGDWRAWASRLPDLGALLRLRLPRAEAPQEAPAVAGGGQAPAAEATRRRCRAGEGVARWPDRLAEENVASTWRSVKGSGPGGRITRDDVLTADSQSTQAACRRASRSRRPRPQATETDAEVVQLSRMRQTIARQYGPEHAGSAPLLRHRGRRYDSGPLHKTAAQREAGRERPASPSTT